MGEDRDAVKRLKKVCGINKVSQTDCFEAASSKIRHRLRKYHTGSEGVRLAVSDFV